MKTLSNLFEAMTEEERTQFDREWDSVKPWYAGLFGVDIYTMYRRAPEGSLLKNTLGQVSAFGANDC